MDQALISQQGVPAGYLAKRIEGQWSFLYLPEYKGPSVSLTLPLRQEAYLFDGFPAVFEGLLPEGPQLEAVLRQHKIDRHNYFRLLVTLGQNLVGSLTVTEAPVSF